MNKVSCQADLSPALFTCPFSYVSVKETFGISTGQFSDSCCNLIIFKMEDIRAISLQVGTKDRKSGVFGGSFSLSGDKAYLARPGLRVWTADNKGKVR